MTQLHSFSDVPFDFHVSSEIPCPVTDWENGVLRAYSQEEQKIIRNWYVERGLVKPLEEIVESQKQQKKIKNVTANRKPPLSNKEFDEFMTVLNESRRISKDLETQQNSFIENIERVKQE
ncbi:MAG: hypothetical protein LBU34_05805 [Planctomycetaceae bacterium]|jgi:DNA replication protein DnaC|nr:hypothetical protein [Planctomycetaceae bacterium]